jgi:hypothetical protein
MNADDVDRGQANKLHAALFPGLNFLVRLMQRMRAKGFPPAGSIGCVRVLFRRT